MAYGQTEKGVFTPNAKRVLEKRYLARNEQGRIIETPEMRFLRVAEAIAAVDRRYGAEEEEVAATSRRFESMMTALRFLPNSPTLMNAGKPNAHPQFSACFVIPIEDDMESIGKAITAAMMVHKTGGGTGFSFSRLRPHGDFVRSSGGIASGPVSFMKIFDAATEQVKQGSTRRGANMGILRVDHPDILEFIRCKGKDGGIRNFNISVAITDAFMKALAEDEMFPLVNPRTGQTVKTLPARQIWSLLVEQAWSNGDPGLFFIDRANAACPIQHVGRIESTNPCGEVPLHPWDACTLGSINIERHIAQDETGTPRLDVDLLRRTVHEAVHFLDNIIDANVHPLPQITEMTQKTRRIGLGVMGFARALFLMGIPYDCERGLQFAESVMSLIHEEGWKASEALARKRRIYPAWSGSRHEAHGRQVRNSYVTCIAPTGTISMIADTSAGCEPEFSLIWNKHVLDGENLPYICDPFIEVARREGWWNEDLLKMIEANHGSCRGVDAVPSQWQQVFATAHDIAPEWHVRMQAIFQRYTDAAVSKTINLPQSATAGQVDRAYRLAYELGCKGITVYRDGSRAGQVLNAGSHSTNGKAAAMDNPQPPKETLQWGSALELPDVMEEVRVRVKTADGHVYLHVGFYEGEPREIFVNPGFGKFQGMLLLVGRLASDILRSGGDLNRVLHHFERSHRECPDISVPIHAMMKGIQKVMEQKKIPVLITEPCPECRAPMRMQEGCMVCACGYSRC
jgi:ribonucleoside-diphosphate reductase alpha chain